MINDDEPSGPTGKKKRVEQVWDGDGHAHRRIQRSDAVDPPPLQFRGKCAELGRQLNDSAEKRPPGRATATHHHEGRMMRVDCCSGKDGNVARERRDVDSRSSYFTFQS